MITRAMFEGGSFEGNRVRLERELGRGRCGVPLARFVLIDPGREEDRLDVEVKEGVHVMAALLAAMAGGRPSFTFTPDDSLLAETFFAAYWLNPLGYKEKVVRFLQRVGAVRVELVWHGQRAFEREEAIVDDESTPFVDGLLDMMQLGLVRAATKDSQGNWTAHPWVQRVILVALKSRQIEPMDDSPPFHFADKLRIQKPRPGVRVVPPGVIRRGACVMPGAIVMPGYVNVGAYVDRGSMVDTFATVGSCAQIGRDVHLAGGVGIGGVLEPPGAMPVIVEDGAFIGSRCIVVEGVLIEEEAVLGAGVILTGSTRIIDMSGSEPRELPKGRIPPRSVVITGMVKREFPAGEMFVPCAVIIGKRTASTDRKVSLNAALRNFSVPV